MASQIPLLSLPNSVRVHLQFRRARHPLPQSSTIPQHYREIYCDTTRHLNTKNRRHPQPA
uniref:Uncharacterized protein n=1 Tax=Arundo donax TaxID=35708 RepID=A0A0A9G6N4_ARUDO